MQQLDIDFARPHARSGLWAWLVLLGGAALSAAAVLTFLDVQADLAHAEHRLERSRRAPETARPDRAADTRLARERAAFEQWQQRQGAPWDALLRDLESEAADHLSIAVLAFNARASTGEAQLIGEAMRMEDLRAFVRGLGRRASVREVQLTGHTTRTEGGVAVIRFTLELRWGSSG